MSKGSWTSPLFLYLMPTDSISGRKERSAPLMLMLAVVLVGVVGVEGLAGLAGVGDLTGVCFVQEEKNIEAKNKYTIVN